MRPRILVPLLLAACAGGRLAVRLEPEDGRPGPPLVLVLADARSVAVDLAILRVVVENRSLAPVELVQPVSLQLLDESGSVVAAALPPDAGAEAVLLASPDRDVEAAGRLAAAALRGPIPAGESREGLVVLRGVPTGRWIAVDVREPGGELRMVGRLAP